MSTQENGLAGNVARPALVNIASSTNANPIVVHTSTAHLLTSGDTVEIEGHATNTSANGVNVATVVDSTHFSIPVAGVGVGGATGTVRSLGFNSTFAIPADLVDLRNAASVNVAFEALADRTAWLAKNTGRYQLLSINSGNGGTIFTGAGNTSITNTGWTTLTGLSSVFTSAHDLALGDLLDINFDGSFNGTNGLIFATAVAINVAGAGLGSQMGVRESSIAALGAEVFVRNSSLYLAASTGSYVLAVQAQANGGSSTLQSVGDWTCIVRHWRPVS